MFRSRTLSVLFVLWSCWILVSAMATAKEMAPAPATDASEVAAARALFQANLDAIRHRDRDAYLACYLDSKQLARTGFEGPALGFESLSKSAGEKWPDHFEALDLQLVPVQAGVVYGTYRYRVRYGTDEHAGLSERLFLKTAKGWRIAVTTAFDAPPGTPPPPRALAGATLVDGTGAPPVPDAVVVLRAGKIECAGPRRTCPVPEGVEVTDVSGLWITPGLVDAHVHFSQTGWVDGRPDVIDMRERYPYEEVEARLRSHPEPFLRADLACGVTAVFDVGGYPWTWDLARRSERDLEGPHVVAAGPLLSTVDHWLNLPGEKQFVYLADAKAGNEEVHYLKSHGAAAVKIWFIVGGDRTFDDMSAAVLAAGEAARRAGLPLLVHATGLREAKVALRAGARLLVHSVGDSLVDDEFLRLAKEKGTIYCPTLTVMQGYARLAESASSGKPPAVDDSCDCVDSLTLAHAAETAQLGVERVGEKRRARLARLPEETRTTAANLARVASAGIPIAMGTDAGNPLTLHGPAVYAEMEAMQAAGLTPLQVLVASTRGGALALGRDQDLGTVEAGKAADLLIVAADPTQDIAHLRQVRYVVRGGVVRGIDELRPSRATKH